MSPESAVSREPNGSNASQSPSPPDSGLKKRSQSTSGLDSNGNPKPVKRRAAKACAACRARKVRCDVMQRYHITADGEVTCSNCTMDGIKCVIEESKRRKKHLNGQAATPAPAPLSNNGALRTWGNGIVNPSDVVKPDTRRWSGSTAMSNDLGGDEFTASHVPHPICKLGTLDTTFNG
jgi:hypothetical protein